MGQVRFRCIFIDNNYREVKITGVVHEKTKLDPVSITSY